MADKPDYLVGNTCDLAAEWEFDFVVSRAESNDKISDAEIDAFWDKVLDAVDACGLSLGGSYRAITDADYEKMDERPIPQPPAARIQHSDEVPAIVLLGLLGAALVMAAVSYLVLW